MTGDWVVYAHPNGVDYVAVDEEGTAWRWPAEANGWQQRARCPETLAESCTEYDGFQAQLAMRLSGALGDV